MYLENDLPLIVKYSVASLGNINFVCHHYLHNIIQKCILSSFYF